MAIKESNQQVYTTLPIEVVELIDKEARRQMRTRSKQIAKIITDYYKQRDENQNDD